MSEKFYSSRSFTDFDEFSENLHHWNITITQLQSGKFSNALQQLSTGNIQLTFASFGGVTQQVGEPPTGKTIVLLADPSTQLIWRKKKVEDNSLLLFPNSSELDVLTRGCQDSVFTLTFAEDTLRSQFTEREYETYQQLSEEELLSLPDNHIRMLRKHCRGYFQTLERDPEILSSQLFQKAMEDELLSLIRNSFLSTSGSSQQKSNASSSRIWLDIENFLEHSIERPVKIGDLCKAVTVSERTLLRLFHERFGMAPKTYLTWNRFNRVRRELKKYKEGSVKVSDIANSYGFWHMGKFAADYRRLFDELPSETLKKRLSDRHNIHP